MAEGDCSLTNNFMEQLMTKQIDLANDTFKMALYTSSYTWDPDGNPVYSATNELSATNYVAGGEALTSVTVTQDDAGDRVLWDADDVVWTALGVSSPRHALIYDDTTASKWIVAHVELSTDANGGDYKVQVSANGIVVATA